MGSTTDTWDGQDRRSTFDSTGKTKRKWKKDGKRVEHRKRRSRDNPLCFPSWNREDGTKANGVVLLLLFWRGIGEEF